MKAKLNRIDPAKLFPGLRVGKRALVRRAALEVGGYRLGRSLYLSDAQVEELVERFRYRPFEPFKPPRRLPPPGKRVSDEDKKHFDKAIEMLRGEVEREAGQAD